MLIRDDDVVRKHPALRQWLLRFPRFTPTSCSWLNAVKGFFAKLVTR